MPERLAIFDIDGTLVPGASSEVRFVRYLLSQGVLGPRQMLAYGWFCLRYALHYRQHLLKKNKAYLVGLSEVRVQTLAADFVRTELIPVLYQPAIKRLRMHGQAGDRVALLSGTPQFLAEALAHALAVDAGYGALCDQRNGVFRAAPPLRHPYGVTKIKGAHHLADALGVSMPNTVAYGDSVQDAHLFRAVGEAVAVQPDPGLSAMAADEGWDVLPD